MSSTTKVAAPAVVAAMTALAATGASLAYVFFTGTSQPPPPPPAQHIYAPRALPLSSKLPCIPDANFIIPDEGIPEAGPRCDYGPLWECIVNGNGRCEALEKELRDCVARSKNS